MRTAVGDALPSGLWEWSTWPLLQAGNFFFFLKWSSMFNSSGETGHQCSFHDIRGKDFIFSILSMMSDVGLSFMAFIIL